jgi:GTP-binding protein
MKIVSAEFVTSALEPTGYPNVEHPEIAFAGRSNVGKSSLINLLLNRKKLARTSSTPGKTQTINFYRVNHQLYMVDLPGYGYTKAPEKINLQWRQSIDQYFRNRHNLCGVFQLIDSRHEPTAMDMRVCEWLMETGLLKGVCAVKTDKLGSSRVKQSLNRIATFLRLPPDIPLIACSSHTRTGRDELWTNIRNTIQIPERG